MNTSWPWDIALGSEAAVDLEVFGQPLSVQRLDPVTLQYRYGDAPARSQLVGVSETTDTLRFVPSLGPIPLLVFPHTPLLCSGDTTAQVLLRLPLHLQVGVGRDSQIKRVDELVPESVSKALYGPVDAGVICTSIHAANGPSLAMVDRVAREVDLEQTPDVVHGPGEEEHPLVAYTRLKVRNSTAEPLRVTKIMIPADTISLYQAGGRIYTSEVSMRLLSAQEAELEFLTCSADGATPLPDLAGHRTDMSPKKKFMFSHDYRSKTGLEYGF